MKHRLAIGTAQFGFRYGIANATGQISRTDAREILRCSRLAGIDTLDTAPGYGSSEQVLGEIGVEGWNVVSKLPALPSSRVDVEAWVSEVVDASLARLGIPRLHGLLVHRVNDLFGPCGEDLKRALKGVRDAGKTVKIGASIYGPDELEALDYADTFDLVQAPFNIVDRRLATSGWLSRLAGAGVEIHVRSAFLQGLLLMPAEARPSQFLRWHSLWSAWDQWLDSEGMTPLQACLAYVLSQPDVNRVIVGVDGPVQLLEILATTMPQDITPPAALSIEDPDLVNPSHWVVL